MAGVPNPLMSGATRKEEQAALHATLGLDRLIEIKAADRREVMRMAGLPLLPKNSLRGANPPQEPGSLRVPSRAYPDVLREHRLGHRQAVAARATPMQIRRFRLNFAPEEEASWLLGMLDCECRKLGARVKRQENARRPPLRRAPLPWR
jgi:hypothetical protein